MPEEEDGVGVRNAFCSGGGFNRDLGFYFHVNTRCFVLGPTYEWWIVLTHRARMMPPKTTMADGMVFGF